MNSDLEITNCVKTLRDGGIIVYPGETGWSLATDLKNIEAAQAILECDFADFKCILLHDSGLLGKYLKEAPDVLWDLVEYTSKPLQLLFENVVNVPAQLMLNNEISFRIVKIPLLKTCRTNLENLFLQLF
ncbi:MAG: Sua5/YciO/YrdC/YwlC family protein [Bacteroidetes bacterium]|nr:Sua5/YciO/YrdC/YwlC family protein [Bacteroidota bacterium]